MENPHMNKGLVRPHELLSNLINDVYKAFELLSCDKDSQFLRRVAVRNVFSFLEGIIHILKFQLKKDFRLSYTSYILTVKEKELLYEEKIIKNGKVKIFIPIEKNLASTFKLAVKVWGPKEYNFNLEPDEHNFFLSAKKARNKLTHPRDFYDIQITDVDMNNITRTFIWIREEFSKLIREKLKTDISTLPNLSIEDFFEKKS